MSIHPTLQTFSEKTDIIREWRAAMNPENRTRGACAVLGVRRLARATGHHDWHINGAFDPLELFTLSLAHTAHSPPRVALRVLQVRCL